MKNIYTLLLTLIITGLGFGQTTLYTQDFETVDDGYTASLTEGSGFTDVFNRVNPNIGGNSTFMWAVEDSNVTPGTIELDQIDVTGYADFTLSLDMLAHHFEDWDSTDELLITYFVDGGFTQNLLWVQMVPDDNFNGPAAIDTDFDGSGECGASTTLPALTTGTAHGCTVSASTFATFSSSTIPLSGNTTLDIMLTFNGFTSGDEGMYIDDILVEGNLAVGCTAPTIQASAYNTSSIGTDSATLNWTSGDGDEVIVVVKEGSVVDTNPTNNTSYTGNTIFGSGTEIGTGNYAVQSGSAASSVGVTGLNPDTTYHVAIYEYNTVDTCYLTPALTGNFTTSAVTTVQYTTSSASVAEGSGTFDLVFEIADEDALNATSFDVVLTSGDAADINSYTTQSVTFLAGSSANETLVITITDDAINEVDETLTFEIQNITGGNSATLGSFGTFDLTITNDDAPPTIGLPYTEDFSVCGTALWIPFSENSPEDDVWTCAPGAYTMNGFGDEDDVDWLISNFSIDFDATSNENIAVTTSERFGDDVNDPGEFELRYSTDYPGFGDPTGFTWTALTFDPNNTSTGATTSADSVTVVDASGITGTAYLAFFYDMTAGSGAEEWNVVDVLIQEGALPTSVELVSTSATVEENSVSYDLVFSISNEDATNATTLDVVLTAGDVADIDSYTTQLVTFPAGDVTNQTITVNITDDAIEEGDEIFTFEIQNVAGGNSAAVGTNTTFNLTISANDIAGLLYDADFSSDGDGFPAHNSGSPPAAGPASVGPFGTAPNQWSLSYDNTPGTDGSDNTFEVSGGELQSRDWGGQGIFTSQVIDVSAIDVVDISALGLNVNANDDAFVYFYILDGGTRVETDLGVTNNGDPINYSVLSLNVAGVTSLEVGFEFSENGGGAGYNISEFTVTEGVAETSVEFASASDTVTEGAGTYNLTFEITFEDALTDTTFDVVLTSGDAADIDGYATQSVNFPAGTSGDQTVTVTITDDLIDESNETFTFEIQNVAGGNNAAVGTNSTFDLTIQDNDGFTPLPGDIVISEIMYNTPSTDDEWIEIYNASGADITLDSDWRLNYGSNSYDFEGVIITAGSYSTIALGSNGDGSYNNDNPFTPDISAVAAPVATTNDSNNLGNTSATIEIIYEPSGVNTTIDTVTYDDGAPWPNAADGNGPSLELIDVTFDNALAASWAASGTYDGGTPGSAYVAPITYTFSGTWSPSDPNGVATSGDDIVIASGDATINANTTCNTLTVNPGAGIIVDTGATLTTANGLLLESTSTSYSSLIMDGSVVGTMSYERHVNANGSGTTGDNDLISAPLTGQSFDTFAAANTNIFNNGTIYLFGPFEKNTGQFVTWTDSETATLDPGVGYRAASDDNDSFTFTGTATNGVVTNNIVNSGTNNAEWNLVGNPYPSYLNVQNFLLHDVGGVTNVQLFDAPTAAIYGYDGSALNGWTIYNLATTSSSTVIAPGQGFFVSADATNVGPYDLEFTPAMRSTGTSDDFIQGRNAELIYVKLGLSSNNNNARTDFYFNANASQGLDVGYDAKSFYDATSQFNLYSHLIQENEGESIALQALNSTDLTNVSIPLGVNANQGQQITFSITDSTVPENVNVYLEDTAKNTITLLNTSDYIVTPISQLSGTGRFFLRFSEDALSTSANPFENVQIYTTKAPRTLLIKGQLGSDTNANIYDIQGRLISTSILDHDNTSNQIDVTNMASGIYLVTLDDGTQQHSVKVIID